MAASDFVTLKGGLTMPLAPVLLLTDLASREITVWAEGDDILVRPWPRVTDEERRALRRWKSHIMALLAYEPPTI